MHELSVALGIVKIAEEHTRKAGGHKVERIELEIGKLSGVEFDSLDFVWPVAVQDTILQDAKREVNKVNGRAICMDCGKEFGIIHFYDACPRCQSNLKNIIKGKELRVMSLEVV